MSILSGFPYSGSVVAGCDCIETVTLLYILRQKENFSLETDKTVSETNTKSEFRDKQKIVICFNFSICL